MHFEVQVSTKELYRLTQINSRTTIKKNVNFVNGHNLRWRQWSINKLIWVESVIKFCISCSLQQKCPHQQHPAHGRQKAVVCNSSHLTNVISWFIKNPIGITNMQLNFATIIPVWLQQTIPSTLIHINDLLSAQAQAIFGMIEYQRVLTTLWQCTSSQLWSLNYQWQHK